MAKLNRYFENWQKDRNQLNESIPDEAKDLEEKLRALQEKDLKIIEYEAAMQQMTE